MDKDMANALTLDIVKGRENKGDEGQWTRGFIGQKAGSPNRKAERSTD